MEWPKSIREFLRSSIGKNITESQETLIQYLSDFDLPREPMDARELLEIHDSALKGLKRLEEINPRAHFTNRVRNVILVMQDKLLHDALAAHCMGRKIEMPNEKFSQVFKALLMDFNDHPGGSLYTTSSLLDKINSLVKMYYDEIWGMKSKTLRVLSEDIDEFKNNNKAIGGRYRYPELIAKFEEKNALNECDIGGVLEKKRAAERAVQRVVEFLDEKIDKTHEMGELIRNTVNYLNHLKERLPDYQGRPLNYEDLRHEPARQVFQKLHEGMPKPERRA